MWDALTEPGLEPLIRLYFDLATRAANGDSVASEAVDAISQHWTNTVLSGQNSVVDPHEQLLGAAVTSTFLKGLLLDRLNGASLAETDAVLQRFIDLVESYQAP